MFSKASNALILRITDENQNGKGQRRWQLEDQFCQAEEQLH